VINGGNQTRDFIYVEDVARVIYKSIQIASQRKTCDVINVLTGKTTSIDKLAEIIQKKLNSEVKKIYKSLTKGDPLKSDGTTSKMEILLDIDLTELTKIDEGLEKTINFIKNNHF
jgi:nucleoside-diphosphate-sugar epimerase